MLEKHASCSRPPSAFPDASRGAGMAGGGSDTCHAREREHPEFHNAPRFAALRMSRRLLGLRRRFVVSHGWIPPFAGMTVLGWSLEMQRLIRGVALLQLKPPLPPAEQNGALANHCEVGLALPNRDEGPSQNCKGAHVVSPPPDVVTVRRVVSRSGSLDRFAR